MGEPLVEQCERDEPPKRRVDAAQIPEVRLTGVRCDELRYLAIRRLMARKGREAHSRRTLECAVSGNRHSERTDGGVAAEDRGVAARIGARRPCGGEHARRGRVAFEQLDGPGMTVGEEL